VQEVVWCGWLRDGFVSWLPQLALSRPQGGKAMAFRYWEWRQRGDRKMQRRLEGAPERGGIGVFIARQLGLLGGAIHPRCPCQGEEHAA